ncbi:TetR/AcrR family transcriptional regulator [Gracilibacillus saliphilus]|uniref:TetR/AcrR family transcriptional regulator n=1 Tax=Gracilibacillus saliphilus TaxID=543890 RepID=UPI0013D861E3|nr:TetR/AcrR family transcriptional regulator [Gracilibacillus saliphilus]
MKGFSSREREIIQKELFEKGKELFGQFGIKKTSVEELTKAVGISKGAFYSFYNSKEELFFDILEHFESEFRERLLEDAFQPGINPKESLKHFLKKAIVMMEENPILDQFQKGEMNYLIRKLPEEKLKEHFGDENDFFLQFVEEQKRRGIFEDYESKAVSGVFKMIFFVNMNKDGFDEDSYDEVIELLVDMVSSYLIKE